VCAALATSRPALAEDAPRVKTDGSVAAPAQSRAAVPAPPALAAAEKQIKETFKDEYQKRAPAERVQLALRLLKVAQETKEDLAVRFVALREAKDMAAAAGDLTMAFVAADLLAGSFVADAGELKVAAITAASRTVNAPDSAARLFETAAQARAANWYGQALAGLSGVRKLLAEKRMQTARAAGVSGGEMLRTAGLVFNVNPFAANGSINELVSGAAGKEHGQVAVVADGNLKALRLASSYVNYAGSDAAKSVSARGSVFVGFKTDSPMQRGGYWRAASRAARTCRSGWRTGT
jgi:hypothetical protein